MATTALVLHRVADYDAWRPVYDSVENVRREGGVTAATVLRSPERDGLVAVTHDFESADQAHAFFENDELKGAMERGGVDLSSFQVHFLERD